MKDSHEKKSVSQNTSSTAGQDPQELVTLAQEGNRKALATILEIAAQRILMGAPLHREFRSYLFGAFTYRANGLRDDEKRVQWKAEHKTDSHKGKEPPRGTSWNEAFSPVKYRTTEITKIMRYGRNFNLCMAVESARADGLPLGRDADGKPGPAFEEAAQKLGKSASQIRKRYYEFMRQHSDHIQSAITSWEIHPNPLKGEGSSTKNKNL